MCYELLRYGHINQDNINRNRKRRFNELIKDLQEGNYEDILNKFNNREYREPFENLFTKIKIETGAIILISNSFVIALGVEKIFDIKPIYHKEKYPKWEKKSIEDKLDIWLKDFKENIKLVLDIELE